MDIIATQKFVKMSPRKVRLVADVIKKLSPQEAIDILPHINKVAAVPVGKVLKTAIANAKDRGVEGELEFKEIQIGDGPRRKKHRYVAKGRVHAIMKRMSHIRIVLTTKSKTENLKIKASKKSKKEVKKVVKKTKMVGKIKVNKENKTGKEKKK